jgi:hypothetical protein
MSKEVEMNEKRYIAQMIRAIEEDQEKWKNMFQRDPVKALQELAEVARPKPLQEDVLIYRIAVITLGAIGVIATLGAIVLTGLRGERTEIPDVVTALGSAAIGALAGLLAPSPRE